MNHQQPLNDGLYVGMTIIQYAGCRPYVRSLFKNGG